MQTCLPRDTASNLARPRTTNCENGLHSGVVTTCSLIPPQMWTRFLCGESRPTSPRRRQPSSLDQTRSETSAAAATPRRAGCSGMDWYIRGARGCSRGVTHKGAREGWRWAGSANLSRDTEARRGSCKTTLQASAIPAPARSDVRHVGGARRIPVKPGGARPTRAFPGPMEASRIRRASTYASDDTGCP